MKIKLQICVAVVFTALTVILLGVVVTFLYFGNRDLALNTARDEMAEARARSVQNMLETIRNAEQTVASVAGFVRAFPEEARSPGGLDIINAFAQGSEHLYGLYFGIEGNGAFYQNVLLSEDVTVFGPDEAPAPDEATRVMRVIDGAPELPQAEIYLWADDNDWVSPFYNGSPTYDPRTRPWYKGALEADGLYYTEPYIFESTGQPGVTIAKRIDDLTGRFFGVAGVDLTMTAISNILEDMRIGEHGLVFMLDQNGRLAAYTGTRASGVGARFLTSDSGASEQISSPVAEQAIALWTESEAEFFHFTSPVNGETHIASIAPVSMIFGEQFTFGLTVPEDEFVGSINRTTSRALQISGLVLILAIAATVIVARLLSRSLSRVADEARRISNFELGDDLELHSRLLEVSELEAAISSMKTGLASFGAYVPTDLVRSIVSRGEMTGVGGSSRDVTLLFTDLTGFTSRAEGLEPEELMPALSRYFEAMETEIAGHSGSVDKYIGDAIMAMWNAPLDDPDHVEHACLAALACVRAEEALNEEPAVAPLMPLQTRLGLHTGRVIVGNVGSLSRMQYTALGAVVNLASRIEALNKAYGTSILASDQIVEKASDRFLFREIDMVSPVGTTKPTKLYELMGEMDPSAKYTASEAKRAELREWTACYELYLARSWPEARAAFEAFRPHSTNTLLVDAYVQRCEAFIANPPEADWDGVFAFTSK